MTFYSCLSCVNWIGKLEGKDKPVCKAFLLGIPEEILIGEVDHTKPYPGDNGIQFEEVK